MLKWTYRRSGIDKVLTAKGITFVILKAIGQFLQTTRQSFHVTNVHM